jgi:hypothetical protein
MSATAQTTLLWRDTSPFGNCAKWNRDMESVGETNGHRDHQGEVSHDETDTARREMLAKMGQFAYAAPALVLLAEPRAVQAYGKGGGGYKKPKKPKKY